MLNYQRVSSSQKMKVAFKNIQNRITSSMASGFSPCFGCRSSWTPKKKSQPVVSPGWFSIHAMRRKMWIPMKYQSYGPMDVFFFEVPELSYGRLTWEKHPLNGPQSWGFGTSSTCRTHQRLLQQSSTPSIDASAVNIWINGNSKILKRRYCTICQAIFCEDIPLHIW